MEPNHDEAHHNVLCSMRNELTQLLMFRVFSLSEEQKFLFADPSVGPLVYERSHQLRKRSLVANLNRKLRSRPGPLDLVTRKILQVDAEVEQAVQGQSFHNFGS